MKHGLKIPMDAENYAAFTKQMKLNENKFKQTFAVL